MQHRNPLTRDNLIVLQQGLDLLERIDDAAYETVTHPFSRHGIGSHFRHCLDFYQSFLAGVRDGVIDYDARQRDEALAKERCLAIARFEDIVESLERLPSNLGRMPLLVRLEHSGDAKDPLAWSESSVMRELQSLVSHTVHHYALIALMLRLNGFSPADEFGVAPSTLEYWRTPTLCAQ